MREYGRLAFAHQPRGPFPERVLLLRAEGPRDSPDRGWGALLGDALEIIDVPGTHIELCREASAAYVAPVLDAALAADSDRGRATAKLAAS